MQVLVVFGSTSFMERITLCFTDLSFELLQVIIYFGLKITPAKVINLVTFKK